MRVIDLAGPQGNAHYLLGLAEDWAKQMGDPPEVRKLLLEDMMAGDYDHLVGVMRDKFKHVAEFVYMIDEEDE